MGKIFSQSKGYNPNYASKIVEVDNIRDHPNGDRLSIITISGDNIVVGRNEFKIGDLMVFCACESALNTEFLSLNNQFRDKELNEDKEKSGFFEEKGRVKAIKLRGEISTGFIFPLSWLVVWQPELNLDDIIKNIRYEKLTIAAGYGFDEVNGIQFSKKYVIRHERQPNQGTTKNNRRNKGLVRFDRLVDLQFSFHYQTSKLADNLDKINPDDIISVTAKFHGTSCVTSHILVNKKLKWHDRLAKRFGINVVDKEYDFVYSSRGVIKNRYINEGVGSGYYGNTDLWTIVGETLKKFIPKGVTLYSEIVGFVPGSNKYIQKDHDYKCKPGEHAVYIYRITYTNQDGVVFEFSAKQVQEWCKKMGLNPVVELYYGAAKNLYPELDINQHWHKNFLEKLIADKENFYMELDSPHCFNTVAHEGIVIRNDSSGYPGLKLKSKRHFVQETINLDNGENDIETNEEIESNFT